ncbi:MAG TPA: hypothetical protein DHV08_07750 [Rhodocyclaceae bacterium]|nr:hypothetical protein [Rhodocyclaceae bacterium]
MLWQPTAYSEKYSEKW